MALGISMKKVLVIVGPTASGKTSVGVECAKKFNGDVISGDSIQIYKKLDIGSAKITEKEKQNIVHHLIDIKEPDENYSVMEFQKIGRELIEKISSEGKLPIVVGGTGLYIKALLFDYEFYNEEQQDNEYNELSNKQIYEILMEKDPKCLEKIHINNRKRLVRALNVLEKHGKGISQIVQQQKHELLYDAKIVGIQKDRDELYQQINSRVDGMFDSGLFEEVEKLVNSGITFDNQSMQGIGYREFKGFFEGSSSLYDVKEQIKKDTRHFAKRQMTWFNNQMNVEWHKDTNSIMKSIVKWLYNQ